MKGAKWRALFCFIAAMAAGCFAAACAEEHVHEYEAVVTPPTCTEQGYTTYTCPEDGESYVGDYVEPLGHTPAAAVRENETAATCTEAGSYEEVVYCSVCKEEISRKRVQTEALGHEWDEGTLTTAPTCTQDGVRTFNCTRCSEVKTETAAATGHIPGPEATCTQAQVCLQCDAVLTEALGHDWDEGTTEQEATCLQEGSVLYACSRCDEVRRESTPKGAHMPETVPGKDATCTDDGLTEGSKCSVCGIVLKAQEVISASGHSWGEWTQTKAPTCTTAGEEQRVCNNDPTHVETQVISASGHSWGEWTQTKAPTCTPAGEEQRVCNNDPKHVETQVISASGHSWTESAEAEYLVSAATCEKRAVYYKSCSACGAKGTETFEYGDLGAHTPETVPGKAATCFAPGLTEGSKCSVCGDVITEQQKTDALPHTFNGNAVCSVCGAIDMSRPVKGSGSTVAVHDPSVIIAYADSYGIVYPEDGDGRQKVYFVFGTQLAAAYSFDMESWVAFTPTFYGEGTTTVSADYYKVFKTVADWSGYNTSATVLGNTWAPDIIYNPELKKWCVYYSLSGDGNKHKQSSVYLMTSSSITGPYVYAGSVVYSGMTNKTSGVGNEDYKTVTKESTIPDRYLTNDAWSNNYGVHCIDPAVMYDEDGELWLFYGSWSGGIALIKLDNKTGLRDLTYDYDYTEFSSDGAVWDGTSLVYDPYMGIHIAGGHWVSGEGPYVEYIDGYYYLFMSYGGYAPDGGYNMRVFRSENIKGRYVDPDGTWAVFGSGGNNFGGVVDHGLSFMQNYKWSWWTGPASLSQGHNSAVVDSDGNAYLVYHIKYDDGTIQHNVEVHRLVKAAEGEDSWYLVAPFQKSGYDRIVTDAEIADLAGNWNVLIHRPIANYAGMEYNTDVVVTLNADGTVSGEYKGSWSVSGQYITITLDGEGAFSGVLMEQQIEGIDGEQTTYTFTAMNENGLCVWGARFTDKLAAQLMADRITFPDTILGDLVFETQGLWGTTIAYSSSDTDVLANDGKFTAPAEDTGLTLTVTVSIGSASISKTKEFTIKGLSEDSIKKMLPGSIADDGYLVKAEPGAGGSIGPVSELSTYTGVSFTFRVKDVKTDWDVMFRTANGTQVYLSVLNYKNVNIFESAATLSEEGEQFLTENGYGVTGFNHVIFLDEVEANRENGSVATISYNVDGSIAFYRNGVLMLTYAADTAIGTGTVRDLVNTMVAQVRTQGLSVVYPVSNVIIGYAADYDKDNVPTRVPIETLGEEKDDGTYTLKFDTWYLGQAVKGDFKVVYDFNVKAPSNTTAGNGIYYLNWIVKIGDWKLRADSYSMDGANNNASLGSAVTHNGNPVDWADFRNAYLNADVILTIERTGLSVTATAKVSSLSTGEEFTYTATYENFGTQDTTVSLGGENCLINVYDVTAESGEGPVEPEFPKNYPAMTNVAETGLSVSFTLDNAVYQAGSPDSTWNALLSAGGYVITFGNLDAFSTTGALKGMNLYPSNSQFGGANWDGLFGQGTIEVTIEITKDSIVFYRNGTPIIQYVRESSVQAEKEFVGPFIDAFLAEVAENGFTFAEVAYDITNVVVGTVQEVTDFEVGTTDNSTGYTGDTPLWTSTIQQGQKITVTGTATSSGAKAWNAPLAYLWTGETASINFRLDNYVNGADATPDQVNGTANVSSFGFQIAKNYLGFEPDSLNAADWAPVLKEWLGKGEYDCTIVWDYTSSEQIVVGFEVVRGEESFRQQYTITPLSGNLLDTYSIGLGVDYAYYHVTGMTVE